MRVDERVDGRSLFLFLSPSPLFHHLPNGYPGYLRMPKAKGRLPVIWCIWCSNFQNLNQLTILELKGFLVKDISLSSNKERRESTGEKKEVSMYPDISFFPPSIQPQTSPKPLCISFKTLFRKSKDFKQSPEVSTLGRRVFLNTTQARQRENQKGEGVKAGGLSLSLLSLLSSLLASRLARERQLG